MAIDVDGVVTFSTICIDICGTPGISPISADTNIVIALVATGVDIYQSSSVYIARMDVD